MSLKKYYDNSPTVFLAKNNKCENRSTHINIKYLVIRKHIKANNVFIEHISIELIITNPLMKDILSKLFKDHVVCMGLVEFKLNM